ncbi:MAG: phosphoribosylglycinamide formyltransferase [Ktedonobacteraceae bacterium]|jgi:phosphoribosylglycinamide formyltransferase 1
MSSNSQRSFEWKISQRKHTQGDPIEPKRSPLRLGVLLSGSGSNLQALIDAIEAKQLPGVEIALVVSNNAHAQGIQRALKHNVPVIYMPWEQKLAGAQFTSPSKGEMLLSETKLTSLLHLFQVNLVVLAGWMRILSASFLEQFPRQVINLHPALLPDDGAGHIYTTSDGTRIPVFRGLHAVRQALQAGVKVTGSSVHYVTAEVDAGPVICRAELPIEPGDTEESLHERLKKVEHQLIVEAVRICGEQP